MQNKLSVLMLKGRNINEVSDINKMAVHLEQILSEKDKIDFKVRQSLTDPAIKSSDYIVFCGYDTGLLSEFFRALNIIESLEGGDSAPTLFLYEEPGQSAWEKLNYLLRDGVDLGRINPKIFNKVVDCWSYRDIIGTIDISIKRLGSTADSTSNPVPV